MEEAILAVLFLLIASLLTIHQLNYLLITVNELGRANVRKKMEQLIHSSGCSKTTRCYRGRVCKPRQFWIRPGRTCMWWDNFIKDVVVPEEWKENFRMTKTSFMNLCQQLRPHIYPISLRVLFL